MRHAFLVRTIAAAAILVFALLQNAACVVIDKIVAVVNGEAITQRELAQHLFPLYEEYQKEYTGRNLEDKMLEAEDMVLDQLIQDKLILSEAKKSGIKAEDSEVDDKISSIVKSRFDSDEDKFREMLAIQDVSLSEMRESIRNEIIKSKVVREKVGWKIVITPSEVRQYYDQHIEEFVEHEKIKVFNILLRKKEGRGEALTELVKKVKELLDSGEDFEDVAGKYSEGPNAKEGGSLGFVKRGEMIKEIDHAIFALSPGEISDVIETPIGYHIFKVTETLPASSRDFDSVKEEIQNMIYQKKISKNLEKWLKEIRENAYISIK